MWAVPEPKDILRKQEVDSEKLNLVSDGCNLSSASVFVNQLLLFFFFGIIQFYGWCLFF